MIQIDKNSWIHRFNKAVSDQPDWWWDEQQNFCPYFWKTVKHFFLLLLMGLVLLCVVSLVGSLPLGEINNVLVHWENIPTWKFVVSPLAGALFVASVMAALYAIAWCISKTVWGLGNLFCRKKKKKVKSKGWLSQMWDGYKNKYCPRMEVK